MLLDPTADVDAGVAIESRAAGQLRETVLFVDDDATMRRDVASMLRAAGYEVITVPNAPLVLHLLEEEPIDAVVSDVMMPGMSGVELLQAIRDHRPDFPVILMTNSNSPDLVVEALRGRVSDFVLKAYWQQQLSWSLERVLAHSRLLAEVERLRAGMTAKFGLDNLITNDRGMQRVLAEAARAAETDAMVLIQGETGTGKELISDYIHKRSRRADEKFEALNCAGQDGDLLESALFGHEKGAFTGADAQKLGLVEFADKGTLFLDELEAAPAAFQTKLLRFLESGEYRRVGGVETLHSDVRIVGATNEPFDKLIADRLFRKDLYYRLGEFEIRIPPLRERPGDIPILVQYLLEQVRKKHGITGTLSFEPEAMRILEAFSWPGNVRQLRNVVTRLAIMADRDFVVAADLPREILAETGSLPSTCIDGPGRATLAEIVRVETDRIERQHIKKALRESDNNRTAAARSLGISRRALYDKLSRYGME